MEHIIKQLKRGAKHARLSANEKAEMKTALLRHVKMNPVRNELFERHQFAKGDGSILSPFQISNLRNKSTMPLLIMLGLLMGGSASFAAENTVPGDMLYPVKVHVNETVRGALAITPKAKAEWDVHLVERRLEEVEKLATTPNALPEARQIAQTNLAQYTNRVKEHIAKFDGENDSEDALATAGDLADTLRAHEGVLAGLSMQVAEEVATSTVATSATSTTSATAIVATSTTSAPAVSVASAQSLVLILTQLRADRGDAEKKHRELERKYHPEVQITEEYKGDNGVNETTGRKHIRTLPVLAQSAPPTNSTSSQATSQTILPTYSQTNPEDISGRNEREEIRATVSGVQASSSTSASVSASASTVPATHTESHTETHTETSKTTDHD